MVSGGERAASCPGERLGPGGVTPEGIEDLMHERTRVVAR
jgi:hypothetical protein